MSVEENVMERIEALAAESRFDHTGRRILSNGVEGNPVQAIMREIDETVLERDLQFEAGDRRLSLEVSSRRILRISFLDDSINSEAALALVGSWLIERKQSQSVADVIQSFAETEDTITVASVPTKKSDAPAHARGIAVSHVADHLFGETIEEVKRATSLDAFVQENGAHCVAFIVFEGDDEIEQSGSDEAVQTLSTFVETNSKALLEYYDRSNQTPTFAMFRTSDQGNEAYVIASDGRKFFVGFCDPSSAILLSNTWGL